MLRRKQKALEKAASFSQNSTLKRHYVTLPVTRRGYNYLLFILSVHFERKSPNSCSQVLVPMVKDSRQKSKNRCRCHFFLMFFLCADLFSTLPPTSKLQSQARARRQKNLRPAKIKGGKIPRRLIHHHNNRQQNRTHIKLSS